MNKSGRNNDQNPIPLPVRAVFRVIGGYIRKVDKSLFIAVCACAALGVLMLKSMAYNNIGDIYESSVKTQLGACLIGLFAALVITAVSYRLIAKLWVIYAPIVLGLVIATFFVGVKREGADDQAWLDLGFTNLQPSELLKIVFIITFAYHLDKIGEKLNNPLHILLLCTHGLVPIGLVAAQGDQGTALVFCVMFAFMLFSAGINWRYVLGTIIISPFGAYFIWTKVFGDIQRDRISILFHPGTDPLGLEYQQDLGLAALGSGQVFGRGLFMGDSIDYKTVPEMHNDFIFSYVGETLGFAGTIGLVAVLTFICIKLIADSRLAKDVLGRQICIGAFALFFSHAVLNIGMVMKVMPVIGIPLPFLSAGGTAAVSMFCVIGLALSANFHNERKRMIFSGKR